MESTEATDQVDPPCVVAGLGIIAEDGPFEVARRTVMVAKVGSVRVYLAGRTSMSLPASPEIPNAEGD